MRFIHPAAWIGLGIDAAIVLLMLVGVAVGDFSGQPPELQQLMQALAESTVFYIAYAGMIAAQMIGVRLILTRRIAGIILACAASFFLMPFSLLYLLGCFFTHFTLRYAMFPLAAPKDPGAERVFRSSRAAPLWGMTVAGALSSLFLLGTGVIDTIFVLVLSTTVAAFFLAFRSSSVFSLAIYDAYFSMFPHFLARKIAVAYTSVEKATLLDDDSIRLDVDTPAGLTTIHWSLDSVRKDERKGALEALAGRFADHGVPMY